ncbi:hypothetical protein AAG607_13705 [Citromicrobium bathyomarinum]|uniref:hypothetical protein n=1 Tax=Citromicrobium bathyomarinum TaxID=72174 RepID=UPI00315AB7BB
MSFLGILGGLLGAGKWLLSGLSKLAGKLIDWVFADWRHGPLLMLAMHAAAHIFLIDPGLRADKASETARANREAMNAEAWMVAAERWEREFNTFVADISARQRAAAEADRANAARVEAEFAALNERTVDDYEAQLAASDARAERLRDRLARAEAKPSAADRGERGAAGVPGALTARCQAFGASDCDGLLRSLPSVLAGAQGNTDKLVGLQQYVEGAALIDFSGSAGSGIAVSEDAR